MTQEEYNSMIVNEQGIIYHVCDYHSNEIYYMSKSCMELYGLTEQEQYRGRKCYEVFLGREEACQVCINEKLKEEEPYYWERYSEKLQRWIAMRESLVTVDGRKCRLEIIYDITSQKRQISELSDRLTVEAILMECVRILAQEKDMDTAMNHFLEVIGEFYCAKRSYIFEFDFEQNEFSNTFEWCAEGVTREQENLQKLPMNYIDDWMEMFEQKGEFLISSLSSELDHESDNYRILHSQGIESLLAAPLIKDSRIVGFLGVDDPTKNKENFTLLRSTADFIVEELEKRRLIRKLEYTSYTDMLTGMLNRNQYIKRLQQYAKTPPERVGIVFVDINGMKELNDNYGHNYGDYILIKTADIIKKYADGDAFRIGGDEFIILRAGIDREEFDLLVKALRRDFEKEDQCEVSIGVSWKSGDVDVDRLVLEADEQMYAEKQIYYQEVFKNGRRKRFGMASEVLKDLAENKFKVFLQPQVDLKTGEIVGAEALVRKMGDKGEVMLPGGFVSVYETEGVIRHVDFYVLETVCAAMQQWKSKNFQPCISVNFSRITLAEPGVAESIQAVCRKYGIEPASIKIEVTESIGKMGIEQLEALIGELTAAGFGISLDDFGSSYSNLAILSSLNFDEVKFDKELVDHLEGSEKSRVVMESGIRMCRRLEHTKSLAEGIETEEQWKLLEKYDCDLGQGFYFSEPLPLEEFYELMRPGEGKGK